MAEFEEKLNALLSDQQAMGQIMSLAKTLSGNQDSGDASSNDAEPSVEETPDMAKNLSDLLSNISGGLDPGMIQMLGRVMKEYGAGGQKEDQNLALLSALRPFLKEKRSAKIDQAVQLAKFSRVARVAFQTLRGGEDPV